MANITRIKANDSGSSKDESKNSEAEEVTRKVSISAKNSENKKAQEAKKSKNKEIEKKEKAAEKSAKKAKKTKDGKKLPKSDEEIGYFGGAVREIRRVRWPDRKTSWKLTFTVIGYVVLVAVFIMLIDTLFTFIFNNLLGGK
ncbi:preprotein translocase subunit SecE [Candidatus Saccharibacteria bacterium]|nr:preprotein translocase subunit SecE [Candidatus Saccharibacteria bacterium]